jgi:non-specific serine/threonine protein kinase
MLETIREFGLAALSTAGEEEPVERARAGYFLTMAERAEAALAGLEGGAWIERLETEHDNLRAALGWSIKAGHTTTALRLSAALWRFWARQGHLQEGRVWLERALAMDHEAPSAVRAKASHYLGNLELDLGDYAGARSAYEASLALRRALDDRQGITATLTGLGLVAAAEGNDATARALHAESLAIERELGNRRGEAQSLHNLGQAARGAGDLEGAWAYHEAALAIQRQLGDDIGIAYSLWGLGEVAGDQGASEAAGSLFTQALTLFGELDDRLGTALVIHGLARVAHQQGHAREATSRYREAMALRQELGERRGVIQCLEGLATLAAEAGEPARAARWWGAATAERSARHAPLPHVDRVAHDQAVAAARAALGEAAFRAAWNLGSLLALDQAAAEAATTALEHPSAVRPAAGPNLTPRERDVLRLLVEGRSDPEIAEALFVAPRTVSWHVGHILGKLEVDSRTAAAAAAIRRGLI